jgi:hypothetical protein
MEAGLEKQQGLKELLARPRNAAQIEGFEKPKRSTLA